MPDPKVWFITGCSRGFGRVWAEAALDRGDRVAASARDLRSLTALEDRYGEKVLPLELDVRDRGAVVSAVDRARRTFGRLDIVVNNAGFGLFGAIEEVSEAEARQEIDTNLLGALWVTQAVLPTLRAQRSGRILQVSSIGGVFAFPLLGLYHASKWGLEGFSQALAGEVRDLGIRVTIIEPGGYATDWSGSSAVRADPNPAYDPVRAAREERFRSRPPPGDPKATVPALLRIVDDPDPPLRVLFGDGLALLRTEYADRLAGWDATQDLSRLAYRPSTDRGGS